MQKNIFLLPEQIVHFRNAKGYHNICSTKLLKETKRLKNVKTVWSYHQQRNIETQDVNIIKSSYTHLELPNISMPEFFSERIEKFSKFVAIECGVTGRKYTFSQVQKLSQKFAVSLLKAGLKPGDVVGVITVNSPEFPIIALGCLEAGLVITTLNNVFTADEIHYQLKHSDAVCLIFTPDKLDDVTSAVTRINNSAKPEQHIKLIALDVGCNVNLASGIGRYSELTADYVDASELSMLRKHYPDPTEVAVLPFSSGTTGLPKGVQLSHNNIVHNLLQMEVVGPFIETTESYQDVVPAILPFYHIYGLTQIMSNSLMFGAKMVTLPKFEPKTFLNMLKTQKCSILYLVPPLVLFLGNSEQTTQEHFDHARWIISGAAPLGAKDLEKCLERIPSKDKIIYVQGYGMTETSPVISFPHGDLTNLCSVGKPLSNTLVKVVNVGSGNSLGTNESGEVCVKGPQVMKGYLKNPEATAAVIDTDGWLHTGDLGYYDNQKNLYITDRLKELIKVKGFQVPPAELEELLRTMPGVKDVGVFGVSKSETEEVPVAFIVDSPAKPITLPEVKTFLSKKVAHYKQLADILIVEAIPKTPSGKILRREMVKMYAQLKQKN